MMQNYANRISRLEAAHRVNHADRQWLDEFAKKENPTREQVQHAMAVELRIYGLQAMVREASASA